MASPLLANTKAPPADPRKYQLFPKGSPGPTTPQKQLDPEAAFALAMKGADQTTPGGSVRIRKDANLSARRRKISVPELGPMTTVQEAAMDSPTIPGLRPVHERSVSAPSNQALRSHISNFIQSPLPPITKEQKDLLSEFAAAAAIDRPDSPVKSGSMSPLVIPKGPRSNAATISSRFRSGSSPNNDNYITRAEGSPIARGQEKDREVRYLPQIWDRSGTPPARTPPAGSPPAIPDQSEGASRIMDRGRPRKRSHNRNPSVPETSSPVPSITSSTPPPSMPSPKRSLSTERRAFETLPQGHLLSAVSTTLSGPELLALRSQAVEQSSRFEIMRAKDVDSLSKELRALDERVEYLRTTYTSLRAGRRNLHGRILTLLKSGSRFSTDSLIKQEESLAELDSSIDEWLAKLDVAENRRTRVRQKLLEHVAAAARIPVMQPSNGRAPGGSLSTPPRSPTKTPSKPAAPLKETPRDHKRSASSHRRNASPASLFKLPIQQPDLPTPPPLRKAATSPVPTPSSDVISPTDSLVSPFTRNGRMESIMIFAASDVYGMTSTAPPTEPLPPPPTAPATPLKRGESQRKPATAARRVRDREVHRSRSFDTLPSTTYQETLPATTFNPKSSTFETPRKSPPPPRHPSAIVTPLTIRKASNTSSVATPTPKSAHDDGVNSDTEVVYLTSAVFSG